MEKINTWMDYFIEGWKNHDVSSVLNLFTNDVEYWETPFIKLSNFEELKKEWAFITNQENIEVNYEVFSNENNRYAVKWDLKYLNKQTMKKNHLKGVYLLSLNSDNKCFYFFNCEELKSSI